MSLKTKLVKLLPHLSGARGQRVKKWGLHKEKCNVYLNSDAPEKNLIMAAKKPNSLKPVE